LKHTVFWRYRKRIPNDHAAQWAGTIGLRLDARELNDLVGADVAIRRDVEFSLDCEDGILLHAGDEEDAGQRPAAEQSVVGVAAIADGARTGGVRCCWANTSRSGVVELL
jgi:hypothetical protein